MIFKLFKKKEIVNDYTIGLSANQRMYLIYIYGDIFDNIYLLGISFVEQICFN